jgi:hypothetical protein
VLGCEIKNDASPSGAAQTADGFMESMNLEIQKTNFLGRSGPQTGPARRLAVTRKCGTLTEVCSARPGSCPDTSLVFANNFFPQLVRRAGQTLTSNLPLQILSAATAATKIANVYAVCSV